ncbi:E3 ubiquitin-protein transferase RMND5B-like isoform X2 [Arctopsyche grandis]|uniref:E3 ubiquitin-protein transferase RMND5B-like isoform X2 n=1 Tax=Arctopsyche grandis TaxID=121162 RepID=UPI00406D6953
MESCLAVEKDIDAALAKFTGLGDHADRVLSDVIIHIQNLNQELAQVPVNMSLTPTQLEVIKDTMNRCKETLQCLASEHRDSHACVSRVGKTIDRSFVAELSGAVPRDAAFSAPQQRHLLDRAIVQHLYRQGLDSVAETLVQEAGLEEEANCGEPFADLHRVVEALSTHDPGPALAWADQHSESLHNSNLPFKLHRLAFLLIGRQEGRIAAVTYARQNFPQFVDKHEKEIQKTMCLLAYEGGVLPLSYSALRDEALWPDAIELFLRDACALLRLPPLSPLQSAVSVGSRVLPALLDIRMKMANTHAHHVWAAKDELPVEVEGGGHHSVFACPILRQQGSDQNPPMRLLCGHVISKDALNKLCQGIRLKCPYCPMEQSQSEARLIHF